MSKELKPCRECGYMAKLYKRIMGSHYALCTKCYLSTMEYNTEQEAIDAWNQRPTPETLHLTLKDGKFRKENSDGDVQ